MVNNINILFLIFNRPETTKKVFSEIRKVKPKKLFIAADGPRDDKLGEEEICEEVRKITEEIDWKCDVKRLYRDNNLGCRKAVSSAIDWFFENVEEGIILEDDCLPNPSFFTFCEKMLVKYRNENSVMHISGDNFLPTQMQRNDTFYFSKYVHVWGWATWRRAWKNYDVNMKDWPKVKNRKYFLDIFPNFIERLYWMVILGSVYNGQINTWDYQWLFTQWKKQGISVNPGVNLIKNIGFGEFETHTNTNIKLCVDNTKKLEKNLIPMNQAFSKQAEEYTRKYIYRISILMLIMQFVYLKALTVKNYK